MSYTKLTDFAAKDALLSGNPSKLLRGTEIGAEFDAIESAMALLAPKTGIGATGTWGISVTGNAATATSATNATNVTGTIASAVTATTQTAGDNSTKVATTAYVDTTASFHKFGAYQILSASGSISSGSIGGLTLIDAASATVDMPTLPALGKTVTVWNGQNSGVSTLTTPGSELFIAAGHWGTATMTLQPGEGLTLMSDGTNWVQGGAGPTASLGYGQTWQNVTGSRTSGTTYYNTTGRPISLSMYNSSAGSVATAKITVNGIDVSFAQFSVGAALGAMSINAIVPPEASYVYTDGGIGCTKIELR